MCMPAFAVSITLVDTTKLPVISTKLSAEPGTYDNLDTSVVTATLDDQELINGIIEKEDSSVEWIFMVDTSKSLSEEYFKAEINAVLYVLDNLNKDRGDNLKLYTFQESIKQVLYGNESADIAKQKINAIVCEGQDTEFYSAIKKLVDIAEKSQASVCVPVIFSDGVETLHPESRSDTLETLGYANAPVYGYYPDILETIDGGKDKIKSFKEIVEKSGGVTKSYNIKNASQQLESFNSNDTWSLTFTASREITAGDHTLSIDMGDGSDVIEKVIKFDETWEGDKEAPTITTIVSDKEENTITIMFSEVIKNWADESLYEITVSSEKDTAPIIQNISRSSDETVVLQLNTLDVSGIKITVKNYEDAAGNVGKEETKSISIDQVLLRGLISAGVIVVVALIAVAVVLTVISKKKKKKALIESGAVQAAYKKGKKIEPKPEKKPAKKEKEVKVKETPEEKAAREKEEKEKKLMEERKRKEADKFQFYFEQNYKDDDDD